MPFQIHYETLENVFPRHQRESAMIQCYVRVCSVLLCWLAFSPVSPAADAQACDAQPRKDCIASADCSWQTIGACESSGQEAMGCAGYTKAKPCNGSRNTSGAKCEWVVSEQCVAR
ncbi:hypothetical protein [Thiocapsa bogorovii]|uniref:hypothetical protein n=1 Tax=Thiocapsa bogorovii TaxID=521689 RepID=UPI001E5CC755|nr:hypothetical protein [Thiocapsa bogorovii]UHD18474.1 hypothetical protein LT988_10775 [Thiocapsa bogorovii]